MSKKNSLDKVLRDLAGQAADDEELELIAEAVDTAYGDNVEKTHHIKVGEEVQAE